MSKPLSRNSWSIKNNVVLCHVAQDYDDIYKFYATPDKFEYVGEGNSTGTYLRFFVDVPNYEKGRVLWFDHARRLGEGSKLLIVCSQEKINQLITEYNPQEF